MRHYASRFSQISLVIALLCAAFVFSGQQTTAASGINRQVNYQGKLLTSGGVPVSDGSYSIIFSLYDAAIAGTRLWTAAGTTSTPSAVSVTVTGGLFTVQLGDTSAGQNAFDFNWFQQEIYLGVTIEADSEMTPRKRLTAVPYAFVAETLQGQYASSSVTSTGGVLFNLQQHSADAAIADRTSLFISTSGTSNEFDYLIKGSNGSEVFSVSRLGHTTTTGNLDVGGNTILGDATSDILTINARLGSNLEPTTNNSFNLGSPALSFANIYSSGTIAVGTDVIVNGSSVCLQDGTNCGVGTGSNWEYTLATDSLSPVTSTTGLRLGGDILPTSNNAIHLGSPSLSFGNIYASSTIHAGAATNAILAGDGTLANPAYSFVNDPDTGLWRTGTNAIRLTASAAVSLHAGGHTLVLGSANSFGPLGNDQLDLGSSSVGFQDLYLTGTVSSSALTVNTSFNPKKNNTVDIGSPSTSFANIYASGTVAVGTDVLVGNVSVCLQDGTNCGVGTGSNWEYTLATDSLSPVTSTTGLRLGGDILPITNNAVNLGSPALSFANIYASSTILAGGGVSSTGNIEPTASATYNLGSSALRWNTVHTDTVTLTNANSLRVAVFTGASTTRALTSGFATNAEQAFGAREFVFENDGSVSGLTPTLSLIESTTGTLKLWNSAGATLGDLHARNVTTTGDLRITGTSFLNGNVAVGGTALNNDILLTANRGVTDPSTAQIAGNFSLTLGLTATGSQTITGGNFNVSTQANAFNQTGILKGGNFSVQNGNTATVSSAYGGHFLVYNTGAGTITNGAAAQLDIQNLVAGGTLTNAYGARATIPFNNGTITNTYGFYVGDITAGTQTNTPFSFYASDAGAHNYFAGNVGIGDTTPLALLTVGSGDNFQVDATGMVSSSAQTVVRFGTPIFPYRLVPDSQTLHSYVDDSFAWFISEQDENSGNAGSFKFVMDNDGTSAPIFDIVHKSATNTALFRVQGGIASVTTDVTVGGVSVCLNDGTNCGNGFSNWDYTLATDSLSPVTSTTGLRLGGDILPTSNNAINLGSPALSWQNIYSSGTIYSGTVTNAFLAGDGTAGAPAYSFINDPDAGLYRTGSNAIRLTAPSEVDLTAGASTIAFTSTAFRTLANNSVSLGLANQSWTNVYASGTGHFGNGVSSTQNITPTVDSTLSLGSSGSDWGSIWVDAVRLGNAGTSNLVVLQGRTFTGASSTRVVAPGVGSEADSAFGAREFAFENNGAISLVTPTLSLIESTTGTLKLWNTASTTYGNLEVGGVSTTGNIEPRTTATYNLGSSGLRWNRLNVTDINFSSVTIVSSLTTFVGASTTRPVSAGSSSGLADGAYVAREFAFDVGGVISGQAPTLSLIESTNGTLKLWNTSSTTYGNLEVGGVSSSGNIEPRTNNSFNIGSPSLSWANIYASSTIHAENGVIVDASEAALPTLQVLKAVKTGGTLDQVAVLGYTAKNPIAAGDHTRMGTISVTTTYGGATIMSAAGQFENQVPFNVSFPTEMYTGVFALDQIDSTTSTALIALKTCGTASGHANRDIAIFASEKDARLFSFRCTGQLFAESGTVGTPADYAEYFYTTDTSLTAGEVVAMTGGTYASSVKRAATVDRAFTHGVISAQPLILGNAGPDGINEVDPNYVIVGLLGQLPVKATNANGDIKAGDLVMTWDGGRVAKATGAGMVVGRAMEDLTSPTGMITVYVTPHWSGADALASTSSTTILNPLGTASATTTSYDSHGLTFRGSAWSATTSAAVTTSFTLVNDTMNASSSLFAIRGTNNQNLLTVTDAGNVNVKGDLSVGGRLFLGSKATGLASTSTYIFVDDVSSTSSKYIATNADGWTTNDTYDYAERFYSVDKLRAGDLVVADPNGKDRVKRSASKNDTVLGIVSTRPGFITGANTTGTHPIALAGRVPTRVLTTNGSIKPGDYLAPSDTPGVAVKAVGAGPTVGVALEAYDAPMEGTISVFVQPGWRGGEVVPPSSQSSSVTYVEYTDPGVSPRSGLATISAGSKEVHVSFPTLNAYPLVTVTPYGIPVGTWGLMNVNDHGFTVVLEAAQTFDLTLAWKAEPSQEGAEVWYSDGTSAPYDTTSGLPILQEMVSPEDPVVEDEPVSETSTSTEPEPIVSEPVAPSSTEPLIQETETTTSTSTEPEPVAVETEETETTTSTTN